VNGEPIYEILTWKDWNTAFFLIGIVGLLLISFHGLTFLSNLRVTKEHLESVIIDKDAEGSTSLLITSMGMTI